VTAGSGASVTAGGGSDKGRSGGGGTPTE
jgi:hypothetical protein